MKMSSHASTQPSEQSASSEATQETARRLVEQLTITSGDWHRLKGNRRARALEQAATAIVFLLNDQTEEGLIRLQQAVGWLDRSISAPPCPTHGQGSDQPKS